ncbi:MAG: hypothetical protein Q9159_001458 [Coniocarpon cinnabarinum]
MPATLTSTKRKFHTLIESLTSRPSSSRSTASTSTSHSANTTANDDPPSKRSRLSPRSSTVLSHPLTDPSSIHTISRATTPNDTPGLKLNTRTEAILARKEADRRAALKDSAQYNPWSADGFLKRLKTFSDLTTWTPGKPDEISEVVWAKRGWSCDGLNRVACKKGCEARIVVALRPKRKDEEGKEIEGSEDFSEEVSPELVKRYALLVREGHHEGCLWRMGRACGDDVYRVGVVRGEVWQRELKERYWSFGELEEKGGLPVVERLECPVDVEQMARYLEKDFFQGTEASHAQATQVKDGAATAPVVKSLNPAVLTLSLTGWRLMPETSSTSPTAMCHHCFRRIGLWLYTRPPTSSSTEGEEETLMRLDLLSSHRHYCPWINGATQAMPEGTFANLPAYEILQRVIAQWAGVRARARKSGARPSGIRNATTGDVFPTSADAGGQISGAESGNGSVDAGSSSVKSREEVREEDKKRFARLRELTRIMGLKRRKKVDGQNAAAANSATPARSEVNRGNDGSTAAVLNSS